MDLKLGNTQVLITEGKKAGLLRNQMAYVLATAYWETASTMKPVREAFWLSEAYRKKNFRYYPYYGRGYVQLTWDFNYAKAGDMVHADLLKFPDLALDPVIAAKVAIQGMIHGWFTTKKLSDFITLQKSDFVEARRIINGKDRAETVAGYAKQYDHDLKEAGYGEEGPFNSAKPREAGAKPSPSPVERQEPIPGVPTPKNKETSVRGSIAILGAIEALILFISKLFGPKGDT